VIPVNRQYIKGQIYGFAIPIIIPYKNEGKVEKKAKISGNQVRIEYRIPLPVMSGRTPFEISSC